MVPNLKARALAAAVLEGEDPKDFLRRHADAERVKHGIKLLGSFEWRDWGIDNSQYFPGAGTAYTDWDEAVTGVGDNPSEAADDALEMAASNGWETESIPNDFPEAPSVYDEYGEDSEDMYYHVILYLKQRTREGTAVTRPQEALCQKCQHPFDYAAVPEAAMGWALCPKCGSMVDQEGLLAEVESPRSILKSRGLRAPDTWPSIPRWRSDRRWGKERQSVRAFQNIERRRYDTVAGTSEPYLHRTNLPHTKFFRNPTDGEHWVEYYGTPIVRWDAHGNTVIDNGGYFKQMTRERINHFLPKGWQIHTYKGNWYWFNNSWPENIRNRLWSDVSARRIPGFPWWIAYHQGDTITPDGDLLFGPRPKTGSVKISGELKQPGQQNSIAPPQGVLHPMRKRRGGGGYDPRQLTLQMEGKYMKSLLRRRRIQGKLDKMKEVKHMQKELEDIDKPDKRKRKLNLH